MTPRLEEALHALALAESHGSDAGHLSDGDGGTYRAYTPGPQESRRLQQERESRIAAVYREYPELAEWQAQKDAAEAEEKRRKNTPAMRAQDAHACYPHPSQAKARKAWARNYNFFFDWTPEQVAEYDRLCEQSRWSTPQRPARASYGLEMP